MAFIRRYKALLPLHISEYNAIAKCLQTFSLRPAKRVHLRFDPFSNDVKSIREFLFHTSAEKYRQTNPNCVFKTEVCNDRTEPILKVKLDNNRELIFKTANLSSTELLQLFNKHVSALDTSRDEPEDPFAKKGPDSSKAGKRRK